MITASGVAKGVATAGATAGILGLGGWAWACAIIGAFFSMYLEKAKEPEDIFRTILSILGWALASAMIAVALPHVQWFGIGDTAGRVALEARAGILGLSLRWAVTNGKAAVAAKVKAWGEK